MRKTIWKYILGTPDVSIPMPRGARILCVHDQHDVPTIWAEVTPNCVEEYRHFIGVPTGGDVPTGGQYLGTSHFEHGMVFHIYEVPLV